jgi:hypothetical protein
VAAAWVAPARSSASATTPHHLRSPREVRNALVYILNNWRKHDEHHDRPAWRTDPFSSADVFDGWSASPTKLAARDGPTPVAPATHFLLTQGWRRHHPPLDLHETPRKPS